MVYLRDFRQSDIEDYVRWFTVDTEWGNWDAPWETYEDAPEKVREDWTGVYERSKTADPNRARRRFEIENELYEHIGWVSCYAVDEFLEHFDTRGEMLAIGIDIPERRHRKKGYGTEALTLYMEHFRQKGVKVIYTQTWSGNKGMLQTAEKLGFTEFNRIVGVRTVNGQRYDALTFKKEL